MLEDVASDKRWSVGSVISSTVPFKIVLQGAYCRFWKVSGLSLFGKSGQVRQQRFFLSSSILVSQVYLVDEKNELQSSSLTVLQRASGVSDVLYAWLCCSSKMGNEDFPGQGGHRQGGRLGLKASGGARCVSGRYRWARRSGNFCRNKRKAQLVALPQWRKVRSSGVDAWVASQFASVGYYPNAWGRNYRQKFFSVLRLNWCEWMATQRPALGLRSARQFEGFVYVDGQLGREPGRYQVPALGKLNVSKWGGCNLLRHGRAQSEFPL